MIATRHRSLGWLVGMGGALTAFLTACQQPSKAPERAPPESVAPERVELPAGAPAAALSGPYVQGNLSIFLFHGEDRTTTEFITLQEGLRLGKVTLTEKGGPVPAVQTARSAAPIYGPPLPPRAAGGAAQVAQPQELNSSDSSSAQTVGASATVHELVLENRGEKPLYVQAGDIVKGGNQDRTLAVDLVIAPGSGPVPVAAFCVERGRWAPRAGEDSAEHGIRFDTSDYALNSKALKLAVRADADQKKVWEEVSKTQNTLSTNIAAEVASPESPTSLQLALEHGAVQRAVDELSAGLQPLPEQHPDALGFAFAINGQLNSLDVYASRALFRQLWPKLLRAAAAEAIAEKGNAPAPEPCRVREVAASLEAAAAAPAKVDEVGQGVQQISTETPRLRRFETRLGALSLRENSFTKD
jgi:hypothetical protein